MAKKIDEYRFNNQEVSFYIPEHEVLISFNNDDDAYAFNEWWNVRGKEDFEKYYSKEWVSY